VANRLAVAERRYRRAAMLTGLAEQIRSHLAYGVAEPADPLVDMLATGTVGARPGGFARRL